MKEKEKDNSLSNELQEDDFDRKLEAMLSDDSSAEKPKKRRRRWSKKKKIAAGAAAIAVVAFLGFNVLGSNKETVPVVATAPLEKSDIQDILSVSGPVSGTDSVDVMSNIHGKIKSIAVKEGDKVAAGQLLGEIDDTELLKELEIAQNSYDLAVANKEENLKAAQNGYAKALQDYQAAEANYNRLSILAQTGSVSQVDLEQAANSMNDARRAMEGYNLENGQVVADKSYDLQIKNAQFNLDKAMENLNNARMTAPIAGTVVRVNGKVGQFADDLENNRPIFTIENLETLELEIQISEYSIGQVEVGQKATITADIMGGSAAQGEVISISPTGEEKGGGSTERVIPTKIRVLDKDTKLIAGITAKAGIVLDEAKDTWVVPISALRTEPDGSNAIVTVENGVCRIIPVTTGVESDISVEIFPAEGAELSEGMEYIVTPDAALTEGSKVAVLPGNAAMAGVPVQETAAEESSEQTESESAEETAETTDAETSEAQ